MLTAPRLAATWILGRKHFVHHGLKKPAIAFCARPLEWCSTEEGVLPKMRVLLKSLLGFIVAHAAVLQRGSFVFKCNLGIKEGNWSGKGEMLIKGEHKGFRE